MARKSREVICKQNRHLDFAHNLVRAPTICESESIECLECRNLHRQDADMKSKNAPYEVPKVDDDLEIESHPETNWLPSMFSGIGRSLRKSMPDRETLRVLI